MASLFIGKNVVELKSTDSTNNYSTELVQLNNVFEGTVVVAETQYSGRGQRGNYWEAEPGKNLTFSIVLYPVFLQLYERFMLTKVVSLGVADYLSSIQGIHPENVKIKWPNDIYINNRKIAGILIENTVSGNHISTSIIGIGLNVNQQIFESSNKPVSLSLLTDKEYNLKTCLSELCNCIEIRYLQLKGLKYDQINSDYLSQLYLINEKANFLYKGKKIEGIIRGVKQEGQLRVESESKMIEADLKEIVFLDHSNEGETSFA